MPPRFATVGGIRIATLGVLVTCCVQDDAAIRADLDRGSTEDLRAVAADRRLLVGSGRPRLRVPPALLRRTVFVVHCRVKLNRGDKRPQHNEAATYRFTE